MKSLFTETELEIPEWLGALLGEIDGDVVVRLRKEDKKYVSLLEELKGLQKRYPALVELLDGADGVTLSREEQEAFHEYMVIRSEVENRERQLFYQYGHAHCYEYLKKLGALT